MPHSFDSDSDESFVMPDLPGWDRNWSDDPFVPEQPAGRSDDVSRSDDLLHSSSLLTDHDVVIEPPRSQAPVPRRSRLPEQNRRARTSHTPRQQLQDDDQVERTDLQASTLASDLVTGTSVRPHRYASSIGSRHGESGFRLAVPSLAVALAQLLPALVMAVSLLLALIVTQQTPSFEGLWAPIVLAPSALLFAFVDKEYFPTVRYGALLNLVIVGVFYPLLIVRQSYLRVPYVEWGNGTLRMPVISTMTIVVLLFTIAIIAAWMSQDAPEQAGTIFLPAAMLVPFFAGATEIVSLRTALIIGCAVFGISGVLIVVSGMLPGAYAMAVAPVTLALEFLLLPIVQDVPIFPLGAGIASKLLFFVTLVMTVGTAVAMPSLAVWVRSVRNLVANSARRPAQT